MTEPVSPFASNRDGTSQIQRLLPALQADFVGIDERSLRDQLMLAHEFAKELRYFNDENIATGNWQALLNPEAKDGSDFAAWLEQIENFVKQPENYADERFYNLHRPHFVLYLTFLQLLKNTQGQLNQLTARHLDFYYRTVLSFKKKPPQADRVNVLIEPSSQVSKVLLPMGALLAAGKDSQGKELVYRTESDLVVNHAKIVRLSSVYVNKQIIGIREAREQYSGTKNDAVMEMLKVVLGDPLPGDALSIYPPKVVVTFDLLTQLYTLVKFIGIDSGLFMEIGELRSLIQRKYSRGPAADGDWQAINRLLTEMGKIRSGDPSFTLPAKNDFRDFDSNIKAALGFSSTTDYFSTLTLAKNFTQLYEQRTNDDVKKFMFDNKLDVELFNEMMLIKVPIDNDWREINRLLERAGQRKTKQPEYQLPTIEPLNFDSNFTAALGVPAYPKIKGLPSIDSLDSFYQALCVIEEYFFMPLEDFLLLMDAATAANTANSLWAIVYDNCAKAYRKKVTATHKRQLNNLRSASEPAQTEEDRILAFQPLMQLVLGVPATDNSDLLNRVKAYLPLATNLSLPEQEQADKEAKLLDFAAAGAELTAGDWDSVVNTLEKVWRNRLPTPVAQKVTWLSLNARADTSAAKVPSSSDSSYWYTFGQRQALVNTEQSLPPAGNIGFAISSPMLCLAQGKRVLTLTLVFKQEQFNTEKINAALSKNPFLIELSSAKGWVMADSMNVKVGDYPVKPPAEALKSISWTLTFEKSAEPITALPDSDATYIKTSWPVLRLMLQPCWDDIGKRYVTDYPLFQDLLLEKALLDVSVEGLADFKLQNDDYTLTPSKPFEVFGSSPATGARLNFGHSELMQKKLTSLNLNLQWMNVPAAKMDEYYANYGTVNVTSKTDAQGVKTNVTTFIPTIADNTVFKCKIGMVDQRLELPLDDSAALLPLFNKNDAKASTNLAIANIPVRIQANRAGYRYERLFAEANDDDVTHWPRYWFLELAGRDFQHSAYPGIASAKTVDLAAAIVNAKETPVNANDYKVNPPYTPKLKSLSIDYSAAIEINLAAVQSDDADQLYHLHPFGHAPIQIDSQSGGYSLLPAYHNEGELYIGLSGMQAPQTLSMLLQMAEGTANPDLAVAKVQWSVLSDNRWNSLDKGQLQADASDGLLQSGIVSLQLEAVKPSTLLPPDLFWLRVAISEGCDSVCDTIGVYSQAVAASFIDQNNSEDHLNQPLPANSLKGLVEPVAGIAGIKQPFTSFGAKPSELDSHFNTRVSERLRHKQRTVGLWDYERLVLEQFPELYKAKCIPAQSLENLGQVAVVVIPDVRNRLPFNPFTPKAPASLLKDIGDFLNTHAPMGANIAVKNACYLPVKLRFAVRFQPDVDTGFYTQKLNEDVNHFLSPWAYEQGKDVVIGGRIYANAIIDFIERCTYVDYVEHFKMFLGAENGLDYQLIIKPPLTSSSEGYFVEAPRPDVVLIAAREHDIDLITDLNVDGQTFKGINYMKLELDFVVS